MTNDSQNSDRSGLNARPAPEQPDSAPSLQTARARRIVNDEIDALLKDAAGIEDLPEPESDAQADIRAVVRDELDDILDRPVTSRGLTTALRYANGNTELTVDDLRALAGFSPRDDR